jgi:hypothetical protein
MKFDTTLLAKMHKNEQKAFDTYMPLPANM